MNVPLLPFATGTTDRESSFFLDGKLWSALGFAPFRPLRDQQGSPCHSVFDDHIARPVHGAVPIVEIPGHHAWSKSPQRFFGLRRFELVGRIFSAACRRFNHCSSSCYVRRIAAASVEVLAVLIGSVLVCDRGAHECEECSGVLCPFDDFDVAGYEVLGWHRPFCEVEEGFVAGLDHDVGGR